MSPRSRIRRSRKARCWSRACLSACAAPNVEIIQDGYGWVPPGKDRLVLGHESLGQVIEAPDGSGFAAGDLVAGIVRRPDPLPCEPCGAASGTSVATATTQSEASRSATAMRPPSGASSPSSR